jgi:hypothetical protein
MKEKRDIRFDNGEQLKVQGCRLYSFLSRKGFNETTKIWKVVNVYITIDVTILS